MAERIEGVVAMSWKRQVRAQVSKNGVLIDGVESQVGRCWVRIVWPVGGIRGEYDCMGAAFVGVADWEGTVVVNSEGMIAGFFGQADFDPL